MAHILRIASSYNSYSSYSSDTLYSSDSSISSDGSDSSICSNYRFKIYYGRTNRLKIKLCHDYCETCYELSTDNDNQRCLSCLPEFQYDFLSIFKGGEGNTGNCVPQEYYYDTNEKKLNLCTSTNYFYIDLP